MTIQDLEPVANPDALLLPTVVVPPAEPADQMRTALGTVAVVGLGYVGLPTAIAFADGGWQVVGYDVVDARLQEIRSERADLLDIDRVRLSRHLGSPTFVLTTDAALLSSADVVVVCVPTPIDAHLSPDLTALRAACADVVRHARAGQTIVLTSTTYVGCTRDLIVGPLEQRGLRAGHDVHVAFSPERIDPGNAVHRHDVVPRVVGGVSERCAESAARAIGRITTTVHTVSSPEAAEAAKLLENTFRAVNIAFVNEFADACAELSLDVMEVIAAAATKPYGFMPFYPGPGVGGHCVPCDPHYLLWQLRARRSRLPITESAMSAIAGRPRQVVDRAERMLLAAGHALRGARVLVVGVTYKPSVQDVRESPALEIIDGLARSGVDVAYHDPMVERLAPHGNVVERVTEPDPDDWALVIVHTVHAGVDYEWLRRCPHLLDATYRAEHLIGRAVV